MNSRWIIQSYEKQSKHIRIICMESTREEACDTLYDSLIPDFSNNCEQKGEWLYFQYDDKNEYFKRKKENDNLIDLTYSETINYMNDMIGDDFQEFLNGKTNFLYVPVHTIKWIYYDVYTITKLELCENSDKPYIWIICKNKNNSSPEPVKIVSSRKNARIYILNELPNNNNDLDKFKEEINKWKKINMEKLYDPSININDYIYTIHQLKK